MTAPMIGNYGVNTDDMESARPQVTGVVVRELSRHPSNWRATRSLDDWLAEAGRARARGHRHPAPDPPPARARRDARRRGRGAAAEPRAHGAAPRPRPRWKGSISPRGPPCASAYSEGEGPHVVAYDYGMKRNIVRMLVRAGCRVTVVPAETSAAEVRALNPDGLFLSNGPGDPAAVDYALDTMRDLAGGGLPTFGICLGHQLVGPRLRRLDGQAAVRPPRRKPSGARSAQRARSSSRRKTMALR